MLLFDSFQGWTQLMIYWIKMMNNYHGHQKIDFWGNANFLQYILYLHFTI